MKLITNYSEYLSCIKEGLITTYNIYRYSDNLHIQLDSCGIENSIEIIDQYSYFVIIDNPDCLLDSDAQVSLISLNNLLGYFPSHMILYKEDSENNYLFDMKHLLEKLKILNIVRIKIKFEGKYEDGLYKNNIIIPTICYHLSPVDNENDITKNGLILKSKNRKSNHPDRIYLFDKYNDYNIILATLKRNDNKKLGYKRQYDLYQINMNDKMILHTDPNFKKGFYTYDSINPKDIKIILNNI